MRTKPVKTYVEVLQLANTAYIAQHLQHHHLHEGLGLDVMLPTGFCSAIRMAAFISVLVKDRLEALLQPLLLWTPTSRNVFDLGCQRRVGRPRRPNADAT